MSIRYIMSEDTRNQFDQTREIITTLYDLSYQTRAGQLSFDGNALAGTFDLIKTQLDDIASKINQYQ